MNTMSNFNIPDSHYILSAACFDKLFAVLAKLMRTANNDIKAAVHMAKGDDTCEPSAAATPMRASRYVSDTITIVLGGSEGGLNFQPKATMLPSKARRGAFVEPCCCLPAVTIEIDGQQFHLTKKETKKKASPKIKASQLKQKNTEMVNLCQIANYVDECKGPDASEVAKEVAKESSKHFTYARAHHLLTWAENDTDEFNQINFVGGVVNLRAIVELMENDRPLVPLNLHNVPEVLDPIRPLEENDTTSFDSEDIPDPIPRVKDFDQLAKDLGFADMSNSDDMTNNDLGFADMSNSDDMTNNDLFSNCHDLWLREEAERVCRVGCNCCDCRELKDIELP
jgi:hypothetical protein